MAAELRAAVVSSPGPTLGSPHPSPRDPAPASWGSPTDLLRAATTVAGRAHIPRAVGTAGSLEDTAVVTAAAGASWLAGLPVTEDTSKTRRTRF